MSAITYVTLFACLAPTSALQAQSPASRDSSSALFRRLIMERGASAQHADTASYRHFVAPEMIYLDDDGSRQAVEEHIKGIAAKGPDDARIRNDIDSLHVFRVGDIALVDYWNVKHVPYGSRDHATASRSLETFVLRDGQWLLLRHTEVQALALPTPTAVRASVLDEYVGQYQWWPGYIDTITRVGDQLFDQSTGEKKATLNLAATPEAFYLPGDASLLVFIRNRAGRVVGYLVHWPDGQVTPTRKLP